MVRKFPIFDNFSYDFKRKIKKKKIKSSFNDLQLGMLGLRSLKVGRISFREVEAIRRAASLGFNKSLKVLFRVVLNKPLRIKPIGSRMGKGRSSVCRWWVYNVQKGSIFCELDSFYNILSYSLINRLLISFRKRFFSYSILVFRYGLNLNKEVLKV